MDDSFVARECPHLSAAAQFLETQHWETTFEFGVDALLDRLRPRSSAPPTGAAAGRGKRR